MNRAVIGDAPVRQWVLSSPGLSLDAIKIIRVNKAYQMGNPDWLVARGYLADGTEENSLVGLPATDGASGHVIDIDLQR